MVKSKDKDCKKDCKDCKECSYQKYQEKALELEVDEELRQDKLRNFWKRYRFLIYGGVIAVLAFTAGVEIYRSWRMKVRLSESDIFEQGVVAAYSNKLDEAMPRFQQLANSGKTGYRYLAQMELAGLALRQNDIKKALPLLKGLMDSDAPQVLRYVATLSYVGYQFDTLDPKQSLQLLQPLLDDPAFIGSAAQMACALYMKLGQTDQAKSVVAKALAQPNLDTNIRTKLEALQSVIGNS